MFYRGRFEAFTIPPHRVTLNTENDNARPV